ncbi:MAG: DUF4403 family protein [Pseudomonadota bacterium]
MPRLFCAQMLLLFLTAPPALGAACFFYCDLTEPPAFAADFGPQEVPATKISLPVGVPLQPFAAQLNAELPDRVHTIAERVPGPCVNLLFTKACADIDLAGWVDRAGVIELRGQDDQILVEIPLHAQVTARGTGDVGKRIRETATAALTVTAAIRVSVTPDWRIEADVATRYRWDQPPQITVAGQTITFRRQVDGPVQEYLRSLEQQLGQQIENGFDLRAQAALVWSRLFVPLNIGDGGPWVRLEPLKVYASEIAVGSDRASLVAGLDARVEVIWRQRPEPNPATPLPPLTAGVGSPGFELLIPLPTPYEALGRMTEQRLGEVLLSPPGNRAFVIDGVRMYPAGKALAVGLTLTAESLQERIGGESSVYLTATPEVRDDEVLLTSPAWSPGAAEGELDDLLTSEALTFFVAALSSVVHDVGAAGGTFSEQLEAALNHPVARGVQLRGQVDAAGVRDFQLRPENLVVWFSVRGSAALEGDASALGSWRSELSSSSDKE